MLMLVTALSHGCAGTILHVASEQLQSRAQAHRDSKTRVRDREFLKRNSFMPEVWSRQPIQKSRRGEILHAICEKKMRNVLSGATLVLTGTPRSTLDDAVVAQVHATAAIAAHCLKRPFQRPV